MTATALITKGKICAPKLNPLQLSADSPTTTAAVELKPETKSVEEIPGLAPVIKSVEEV